MYVFYIHLRGFNNPIYSRNSEKKQEEKNKHQQADDRIKKEKKIDDRLLNIYTFSFSLEKRVQRGINRLWSF